jgi:hypothetical protein
MAALVKTSTSLATGGLTLLRQEISVQSASEITLNAEYICLPAYADTWTQRLRVGAPTPLPAPTATSYYNLLSPLALASVSQNIAQGLCYFSCTFSAPRDATTPVDSENPTAPQFETTVTSIVQEQSLSGTDTRVIVRWRYDASAGDWERSETTATTPWVFQYDSETRTVTASSEQLINSDPNLFIDPASLYISEPRFLSRGTGVNINTSREYIVDTITRTESFVSSKGSRRYSVSMQKVYLPKVARATVTES